MGIEDCTEWNKLNRAIKQTIGARDNVFEVYDWIEDDSPEALRLRGELQEIMDVLGLIHEHLNELKPQIKEWYGTSETEDE